MESGAGSTMLKFGLLLVLANLCLKLLVGIGLWNMAMEYKNSSDPLKVSDHEERIAEGNPEILRGQNKRIQNEYENDEPNN